MSVFSSQVSVEFNPDIRHFIQSMPMIILITMHIVDYYMNLCLNNGSGY